MKSVKWLMQQQPCASAETLMSGKQHTLWELKQDCCYISRVFEAASLVVRHGFARDGWARWVAGRGRGRRKKLWIYEYPTIQYITTSAVAEGLSRCSTRTIRYVRTYIQDARCSTAP
eukprot:1416291-Pleurochrysis_carterae.AAC.2